jgi:hypothetical protein
VFFANSICLQTSLPSQGTTHPEGGTRKPTERGGGDVLLSSRGAAIRSAVVSSSLLAPRGGQVRCGEFFSPAPPDSAFGLCMKFIQSDRRDGRG